MPDADKQSAEQESTRRPGRPAKTAEQKVAELKDKLQEAESELNSGKSEPTTATSEASHTKTPDPTPVKPPDTAPAAAEAAKVDPRPTMLAKSVSGPGVKFFRGILGPKQSEYDPECQPCVEGETISVQRGVESILPEPFIEALKTATQRTYSRSPGQGLKVTAIVSRFHYTVLGPATYEEFIAMKQKGTKETKDAVAKHGLAVPIAASVPQLD